MPKVTDKERLILGYISLLHDIGKPMRRANLTSSVYAHRILSSLGLTGQEKHDIISRKIIEWFLGSKPSNQLYSYVNIADRASASERAGLYSEELALCVMNIIREFVKEEWNADYSPENSPLLTPLWVLNFSSYIKDNKYCVLDEKKREDYSLKIFQEFYSLAKELQKNFDCTTHKNRIRDLLLPIWKQLLSREENYWIPVLPLELDNLGDKLKLSNYSMAQMVSMYKNIIDRVLRYLELLRNLYGNPVTSKGALNSLERLLSITLMLVPSGVYGSLFPDIGLYSHSRIVAALTDIAYKSESKLFQYLLVDLNGIQRFIYSTLKEAAASRVLRGRSLIVQILSHIVTDFVLEEYDAPRYSYIVREGGSSLLLVKYEDDKEPAKMERVWKNLLEALYKDTLGELYVTLASSGPIDMKILSKGEKSFIKIYEEASKTLERNSTISKLKRDGKLIEKELITTARKVVDSDYITGEPVFSDDEFKIDADNPEQKEYLESIAPGKIESGKITGLTHMSLVAGTLARNLSKIIIVEVEEPNKLYNSLLANANYDSLTFRRLYFGKGFCNVNGIVGVLPFLNLKRVVLLVSYKDLSKETIRNNDLARLLDCLSKIGKDASIRNIIVYNIASGKPSLDLPDPKSDNLKKLSQIVQELENNGISVIFDYMIMSTHHPVKEDEGTILGLDEIAEKSVPPGIIAVAKIDGDNVGDAIRLFSYFGPSRLAMFSDMMNLAFQILPLTKLEKTEEKDTLVFLYGGGDDIVVYGGFSSLINYIGEVYESISSFLQPLTYTAAIAFDRYKTPILYLYSRTSRLLDKGKAVGGNLLVLEHVSEPPPYPIICEDSHNKKSKHIVMLPGIPLDANNKEYQSLMKIVKRPVKPDSIRLIYRISDISSTLVDVYNMRSTKRIENLNEALALELQALVYYSYLIARHGERICSGDTCKYRQLEKIRSEYGLSTLPDPPWETKNLENIAMTLARLKPVIDTYLLLIRETR